MIMFWNRKEIFSGFLTKDYYNILKILKGNQTEYDIRVVSLNGSDRESFGSFGEKQGYSYQYYIYVNRKDYEKAEFLLNHG